MDFTELKRDTLARHLRKHLEGEVRFDKPSRRLYSTDASIYQIEPLGVVIPKDVEDLAATAVLDALLPNRGVRQGDKSGIDNQGRGEHGLEVRLVPTGKTTPGCIRTR